MSRSEKRQPKPGGAGVGRGEGHFIRTNFAGRVRNTHVPVQHALLPIIEAVVNSIHATEERFGAEVQSKGRVQVLIRRVPQPQLQPVPGRHPVEPVIDVTIIDNGAGFNDRNLESFETADSTIKASQGGRGVGRFTWLVVFEKALVTSTYPDGIGKFVKRSFTFEPSDFGIAGFTEETRTAGETETRVLLSSPRDRYAEALRKGPEVIVERIFEHCFNYLVLGRCPLIQVTDDDPNGATTLTVNDGMAEVRIFREVPLQVGQHQLAVLHAQQASGTGRRHEAHLCADQRVVTSFSLSEISDLGPDPLRDPDGAPFVHHAFVSGLALNEAVDATRTRLDLPDGDYSLFDAPGVLDMKALRAALGAQINEYLGTALSTEREETFRRVEQHIRTAQPEYRHLLTNKPEQLKQLKWTDNPRQLDEALYRINQALDVEIRQKQADLEAKLEGQSIDVDAFADELYALLQQVNETGQANLVRYVTKRRAVLKVIRQLLGRNALESHIHQIVFPIHKTADEVPYDNHNLWLFDDALSFYEFVASDVPFSENPVAPVDSLRRPDLLAFKTGDPPFHHVALVELKRPERKDESPVQQIVDYAIKLREGGARDADGRSLPGIPKSVRIDAYGLVTLTPEMEKLLRSGPANMVKAEGDWRWFGTIPAENLSVEVLDFQTFVLRAEQRNRAFFTKLGLI